MRNLPAELIAAQKNPASVPFIPVTIENRVGPVRRYDYTVLDTTVNAATDYDAAVPDNGALCRFRANAGDIHIMRVTNPATGPWTTWTILQAAQGAAVGAAAKGARVIAVYSDAGGQTNLRFRESTDNGATFGADTLIGAAGGLINNIRVAYKNSTGDLLVAWRVGATLSIRKRTGGVWAAAVNWPYTAASLSGIAVTFNIDYDMVVTGAEVTSAKPTVWSLIYGDGGNIVLNNWGSLDTQVQADVAAQTTYDRPSISATDTYRITFRVIESYAGGDSGRAYRTNLHPLLPYNHGRFSWTTPAPTPLVGSLIQCNNATVAGGFIYESNIQHVQRAPRDAVTITATGDVLELRIDESLADAAATLILNNDAGKYAGTVSPLQIGNLVEIGIGYYTTADNFSGSMLDLWIADIEHRRDGGRSTVTLHLESAWGRLRRNNQRTQITHTTDHVRGIIGAIMARAGLTRATNGASARSGSVTPVFTIHPTTSGYEALQQALAIVADKLFMRDDAGALFTEPLAAETTDYTFGTDHPLYAVRLRAGAPRVSRVIAIGAPTNIGSAIDLATAQHALARVDLLRDVTSTSAAAAAATADARLRSLQLEENEGEITVPPACNLELLDVIDFADALVDGATIVRRVRSIQWRYDKQRNIYEQTIGLGPR